MAAKVWSQELCSRQLCSQCHSLAGWFGCSTAPLTSFCCPRACCRRLLQDLSAASRLAAAPPAPWEPKCPHEPLKWLGTAATRGLH